VVKTKVPRAFGISDCEVLNSNIAISQYAQVLDPDVSVDVILTSPPQFRRSNVRGGEAGGLRL